MPIHSQLISEGPTHRFAAAGNVIVAVYFGTPQASALETRVPWMERAIERHGQIGQLVVVTRETSGSLPGREFREASRAQTERFRGSILFSAAVIEGEGLQRTLMRTFLRGLAVVAGRELTTRLFDEVGPAAEWVSSLAAQRGDLSASDLVGLVDRLRPVRTAPS